MAKVASAPWARRYGWDLVVAVALVACCFGAVALHIHKYLPLSPLDEMQLVDYTQQVADGHVPRQGERVGHEALGIAACRDIDLPTELPECGVDRPVEIFPEQGYNTSLGHSPLYFWITAAARTLFEPFDDGDGVSAMRATGAPWLAVGAVTAFAALRLMGARRVWAGALALASALGPGTLYAASTTNNDVGLYTAGSGFLLLAVLWLRRDEQPPPWKDPILYGFAALACFATLIKASAFLGVLFVVAALLLPLVRGLLARGPEWLRKMGSEAAPARSVVRSALVVAGAGLLACLVAAQGWRMVMSARGVLPIGEIPMFRLYHVDSLSLDHFFGQYFAVLPPLRPTYVSPLFNNPGVAATVQLAVALQLAVVLLPLMGLRGRVEGRYRDVLVSIFLVLAISGPTLVILNYLALSNYQGIPARYGLALVVPMMGAFVVASKTLLFRVASSVVLIAPAVAYMAAVAF